MALSVNNSSLWHLIRTSLLLAVFSFNVIAQDTQPTLEAALAINDPAARIEALQKLLQAQPDAPQAEAARAELTRGYAYLGEMQLADRNVDGAIQNFKQAISSFPKQMDDKFFDEVAARIPLAVSVRGYRTEAILLAREMEVRFANEAKRLTSIGEFYLSLEAPNEALRALNTAVKLVPDDARTYRVLGTAHRINLNLDKAAEQFTAAIKADPKDSRAYFELANLQRARGRYEVAINLYNHQLGIEPEHAPSLKGLALCHLAQGKDDRANELLEQAAKLTNTDLTRDFYLQTQLALTHLARGNVAKARQAVETALAAEPRFSWARIAAAEVELAEGKYFEAERNVIAAMKYADFPTLHFTLGKIYLAVEDFEGALVELGKAYSFKAGKFQTRLGGVQESSAETVAELLAPERQASMFLAEPITTEVEFKLAENLSRFETALRGTKSSSSQLVSAMVINQKTNKAVSAEVEKSAEDFVETEGSRKPFRWLYTAERLAQTGQSLETALKLIDQALDAAEAATASDGSVRDYPNYDRDGRLGVFRGRALTLRGRTLTKLNRAPEAITTLEQAIDSYGRIPERNRAQWQLALAKESAGQPKEALDLYIAAYEPPDKSSVGSDLNRTVIEALYRKVNGSLDGLNDRIGKARETALATNANPIAPPKPVKSTPSATPETKPTENLPTEAAEKPAATVEAPAAEPATPEVKAEAKPEAPAAIPIVLPEAKLVAATIGELAALGLMQEPVFSNEDAPPVALAEATKVEAPAEESRTPTAPVVLPEGKSVALVLPEDLAQLEIPHDLRLETEEASLPLKATEFVATTPTAPISTEEAKPTTITQPVLLPEVVVNRLALVALTEESAPNIQALAQEEINDPAPPVETETKTNTTTDPLVKVAEPPQSKPESVSPTASGITTASERAPATNNQTDLSDARVAEIEKAISNKGNLGDAIVGKKGNGSSVLEEAVNGHLEGDAPVRVSKAPEPILPAGESGRVVPTPPKVNTPESLPAEVEMRAKAMGQSAGKLSAGAALEVETDKPAGQGRKGVRTPEEEEEEAKPKTNERPRRVKENEPTSKPRNQ